MLDEERDGDGDGSNSESDFVIRSTLSRSSLSLEEEQDQTYKELKALVDLDVAMDGDLEDSQMPEVSEVPEEPEPSQVADPKPLSPADEHDDCQFVSETPRASSAAVQRDHLAYLLQAVKTKMKDLQEEPMLGVTKNRFFS